MSLRIGPLHLAAYGGAKRHRLSKSGDGRRLWPPPLAAACCGAKRDYAPPGSVRRGFSCAHQLTPLWGRHRLPSKGGFQPTQTSLTLAPLLLAPWRGLSGAPRLTAGMSSVDWG